MSDDGSSEIERIASSNDPPDKLVRAIRALGQSGTQIDPIRLATLLDRPERPVQQAALKLLKVEFDRCLNRLAQLAQERPALHATTIAGAQRLVAAVAPHDRGAVGEVMTALAAEHLYPTAADAVRQAAELDARRRSWEQASPTSLDGWPRERDASWRNALRWVEARLGRKPVVAIYLSAGVDYAPLRTLVAAPTRGLPAADLCVYVDREQAHIPVHGDVPFAADGREVPFLGRLAHLAELHLPATADAAGPAYLLTVRASNEEVCQHANRERRSFDIVVAICDGCRPFGGNLVGACPSDLRRPLLERPPKWWVTDHGIRTQDGPWQLEPHTPPIDGRPSVWSVRRRRPPPSPRRTQQLLVR